MPTKKVDPRRGSNALVLTPCMCTRTRACFIKQVDAAALAKLNYTGVFAGFRRPCIWAGPHKRTTQVYTYHTGTCNTDIHMQHSSIAHIGNTDCKNQALKLALVDLKLMHIKTYV